MSAPSSGSADNSPAQGFYPDPSIPGYIRYWSGTAWVPGTSRPAPAEGEPMPAPPAGAPKPQAPALASPVPPTPRHPGPGRQPAQRPDETGPMFLDEEPALRDARSEETPAWRAEPARQEGFGGEQDQRVSWGDGPGAGPGGAMPGPRDPRIAPPAGVGPARSEPRRPEPQPAGEPAPVGRAESNVPAVRPGGTMQLRTSGKPLPSSAAPGWPDARAEEAQAQPPAGPQSLPPERQALPAVAPAAALPAPARPAPAALPERQEPRQPEPGQPESRRPEARRPEPLPQQPRAQELPRTAEQARPAAGGWAQQVQQLAKQQPPASSSAAPAASSEVAAPWKPVKDDPFLRAAQEQGRPAPLGRRLVARLVDSAVLGAVVSAVAVPLWAKAVDHIDTKVEQAKQSGETVTVWLLDGTTGTYLAIVVGVLLVAGVVLEALPTAKWGRTLGKRLCGTRVLDIESHDTPRFGAALRRWLVYGGLGVLGIGVIGALWCVFDRPWRQCWHDKAARTFVAAGKR
ncbi:RDD family protein [Streptomyces sp. NPDC008001]|uniref:RDD family protein n=1 Tax=Streptomyces sp. NPDC008001 TaxID=3364804 RepID=UPI0036E48702